MHLLHRLFLECHVPDDIARETPTELGSQFR